MNIPLVKFLRVLLAISYGGLISASAWASGPNTLVVVRAGDNTLWKTTCVAGACGSFTQFPGLFGSQPTVTWEERNQTWLLFGTAPNGTIWKSSFSESGVFLNDWVQIPGTAANPPGAASRTLSQIVGTSFGLGETAMTAYGWNAPFNLYAHGVDSVNSSGLFQCTATGMASINRVSTIGTNTVFLGLSESDGAFAPNGRYTSIELPSGTPTGQTTIPISVTSWFYTSSPTQKTIYIVGQWAGNNAGATIVMKNLAHHCQFFAAYY